MVDYASEEEQIEALKRWWHENGRAVIAGALIGVLALAGWRGWSWYQDSQAEGASVVYNELSTRIDDGGRKAIVDRATRLRDEYGGTAYAPLGALAAARAAVDDDDLAAAAEWLRWAMDNAGNHGIATLARARLARVEFARERYDQALDLVDGDTTPAYTGLFGEIRGDVLLAQDRPGDAVEAYRAALDAEGAPVDEQTLERKLDQAQAAVGQDGSDSSQTDSSQAGDASS